MVSSMVFGYFLKFSSLEIADFAHISFFLTNYLGCENCKNLALSNLQFLPSKVTCAQLTWGPFKNDVTAKLGISDPSPPCHR
jgi:hypothetical protein